MKLLRLIAINLLVLSVLYLGVEWYSLPLLSRVADTPFSRVFIPRGLHPFLQSSKQSLVPRDYIALTGDSHAAGLGDWLDRQQHIPRAAYHSAHLLHQHTGRDVVTFGVAGAGSLRGLVSAPLGGLAYLKAIDRYTVQDPDLLLVYFYEGNDPGDNIEYVANHCRQPFDEARRYQHEYIQQYIQSVVLKQDPLYQQAQSFRWFDNFFIAQTLLAQLRHKNEPFSSYYRCSPYAYLGRTSIHKPGRVTQARIDQQVVTLPDALQAPPTDLDAEELNFSLFLFSESLYRLKHALPDTRIGVLYIPSVLASYTLVSERVSTQPQIHRQRRTATAGRVMTLSDQVANAIAAISRQHEVAFVDARPAIRQAGRQQLVHGPDDWNHFNRAGYQALADAALTLVSRLEQGQPPTFLSQTQGDPHARPGSH